MFDLTYEELKKLWAYLMAEGDSEMKSILEKLTRALAREEMAK